MENGLESSEGKYFSFQTTHLVKLKIPGKNPTMPVGRKIGRRICLDSLALNECAEKNYRKIHRPDGKITCSGACQGTINRFNL